MSDCRPNNKFLFFNKFRNKRYITIVMTIIVLVDMGYSYRLRTIIPTTLMTSNIFHLIDSERTIEKYNIVNTVRSSSLKNIFWTIFNTYQIGYIPYEISAFMFLFRLLPRPTRIDKLIAILIIMRHIPFYIPGKTCKTGMYEALHSIVGIVGMAYFRIR